MTTQETMTVDEALVELAAVGVNCRHWVKRVGDVVAAEAVYVNGTDRDVMGNRRGSAIDAHHGMVNAWQVWAAISNQINGGK